MAFVVCCCCGKINLGKDVTEDGVIVPGVALPSVLRWKVTTEAGGEEGVEGDEVVDAFGDDAVEVISLSCNDRMFALGVVMKHVASGTDTSSTVRAVLEGKVVMSR